MWSDQNEKWEKFQSDTFLKDCFLRDKGPSDGRDEVDTAEEHEQKETACSGGLVSRNLFTPLSYAPSPSGTAFGNGDGKINSLEFKRGIEKQQEMNRVPKLSEADSRISINLRVSVGLEYYLFSSDGIKVYQIFSCKRTWHSI